MKPLILLNPLKNTANITYKAYEEKKKITGIFNDFLLTGPGANTSVVAAISAVLQIIEPSALPYDISPCPFIALVTETIVSGSVVPIATIVAPITISDMLKNLAISVAASTKKSDALMSNTKPSIINKNSIIILNLNTNINNFFNIKFT